MTFHCMFEQSGTFKNEFKKLGYNAIDYDIQNEFGQTDNVIDLFEQIETAYAGGGSVFDAITKDDMILAFFPCVRFEDQAKLWFQGTSHSLAKYSLRRKLETDLKFHDELHRLYGLVTKLVIVCIDRGLKLVIENPYSVQHYLTNYWALKPAVIEHDRSAKGDYFKKPTQFFFVNCGPKNNFIFEPQVHNIRLVVDALSKNQAYKSVANNRKTARSMIAPEYANRFIREFLIDERT